MKCLVKLCMETHGFSDRQKSGHLSSPSSSSTSSSSSSLPLVRCTAIVTLHRDLSWVSETVSPCVQRVRVYNCGKTSIPRRGWVRQTHLSLSWICIYNFVARVVAITSILIPVLPTQKIQTTKTFFEEYMLSRVWKEGGNVWGSWVKIPCHAMPCLALPYHTQSNTMPCHIIPYHAIPPHGCKTAKVVTYGAA